MRIFIMFTIILMPVTVLAMEDGVHKEMHASGKTKAKFAVYQGIKEGAFKEFYQTGEIRVEGYYKNGQLHGKYIEYFKNGSVKIDMIYKLSVCRKYQKFNEAGKVVSTSCPKVPKIK